VPAPRSFPASPDLKKIVRKGETATVSGKAMIAIKNNWKDIVYDICSGLSASDIAAKYGIGRMSFFRFLQKIGLSISEIQKACKKEEEFKRMTKQEKLRKKMERLKVLPANLDDFKKLPIIEEYIKQLRLKGNSQQQIYRNVKFVYEVCRHVGKMPEDLTIDDILSFIDYKRLEWEEKGKDLRSQSVLAQFSSEYISPARMWAKYRGLPIPPALTTVEYHSPYRRVRITVEQRYMLLKWIKENYPNEYDLLRAVMIFLYETGSRAAALTNVQFLETEEFGIKVVYAITEEKGKRARIRWEKPINPKWYEYIRGRLPISESQLNRVRRILREAYDAVLPEGLTKKYAMEHPIHIWRHTAANDLLEASGWNLMLVAKKLGWKNPAMIVNVYGDMDKAALLKLSGYNVDFQAAKHEFLYNEWEKKAREEGLI